MSRKSSREMTYVSSYTEITEPDELIKPNASKPPPSKKARKVAVEKQLQVRETFEAKAKNSVGPKRRMKGVKTENSSGGAVETAANIEKSPWKPKTKSEEANPVKPEKPIAKRKAEANETRDAVGDKNVKKRKTKEEKEDEAMPLAPRTPIQGLKRAMHIGAHISGAGGVHNSVINALHIGANTFALFLKSQRKWSSPPLTADARDQFRAFCKEHSYDAAKHVLPHGSYLVNLAQAEPEKAEQAYACFLDDLHRCEALGIKLYNFHPGNAGPHSRKEAIARIATQLNKAHKATKSVVTILENMAGTGNTIGSTFEDLRDVIALIDDKSRVGVCIDTCHAFAAGYDLRSPQAFKESMDKFDSVIGMCYLKALHLNDSKAPFASHRDLHANIGTGFLGLRAFHNVVNYEPFEGLPMVLETPIDKKGPDGKIVEDKSVWAAEIKLLEGLIGADPESNDFKAEEQRLQDLGVDERKKFQGQVDKKTQKAQKTLDAMFKGAKGNGKKKRASTESDTESDGGCNH